MRDHFAAFRKNSDHPKNEGNQGNRGTGAQETCDIKPLTLVPLSAPLGEPLGNWGTAKVEIDLDERIAMALEGDVPAIYAEAFARMQVADPYGPAVDNAGRFLDTWGSEAERLGWSPEALFGPGGLIDQGRTST